MSFAEIDRDGVRLRCETAGEGPPVVFQHGLGGDAAQVAEVFPDAPVRRLTVECRAQGGSEAGPFSAFSIATFAADVAFVAAAAGMVPAVAGGISMGAAIALRLAVRRPDLVTALVLARPAWLFAPAPENLAPVRLAAATMARLGPEAGRAAFAKSDTAAHLADEAPDNLASLLGFFDRPDPRATAALVAAIAADGPGVTADDLARIRVPTLVIGTGEDAIHPMDLARRAAEAIPGARLVEIASKSVDRPRHVAEFRAAVAAFLSPLSRG